MAQKLVQQDVYIVRIEHPSGTRQLIKVSITEGYSTKADIPKIVDIANPGAKIVEFVLYSTREVPSIR